MKLKIDDHFTKELPADANKDNARREVFSATHSYVSPRVPSNPEVIHVSKEVAEDLGLSEEDVNSEFFRDLFSGAKTLEGSTPYAMCYGGHQFGNWAGQLGDGRAINLMEIEHQEKRWTLQLKGAGETPYSRGADGLAVLRSSIREHLCSEAMYHLGVPTTRSLSLSLTGDQVYRDIMYDGNPAYEKGAVVCRVAPSFIRFGNFEIFSNRGDYNTLEKLTQYTIKHYFPAIEEVGTKESYKAFFNAVLDRSMAMVIEWQRVGFVHGVMNTDNMSILGLTIDYGPYGWLENFDPDWTPNTTDRHHRRYRFKAQPSIIHWNLYKLANALFPLVEDTQFFTDALNDFTKKYPVRYLKMIRTKFGFEANEQADAQIINGAIDTLQLTETDMTIFFRNLGKVTKADTPESAFKKIEFAFYDQEGPEEETIDKWNKWLALYIKRLSFEKKTDEERKTAMDKVNPKYVLRNYMAQLAIEAADQKDYSIINELYELLKQPYAEQPEYEKWFAKRPEWARNKIGCSMLSCSS